MNKTLYLLGFLVIFLSANSSAIAQENWVNYVTQKSKGYMSIGIDLKYTYYKPNYKNIVFIGTKTNKCFDNGFPKDEGLEELYRFSDTIANEVNQLTKNKLVSIVTYQCYGLDVFYVKDTVNLRNKLDSVIKENFIDRENYIYIKDDKKWEYYKTLYPKNLSDDFFMNHELLIELLYSGDDLHKKRNVKHWVYFNNIRNRTKFSNKAKELDFNVDSINYKKGRYFPYELQLSRKDHITPSAISNLTNILLALSYAHKAEYDGWGIDEARKEE